MSARPLLYPFLATLAAIALLSLMDAFMKSASLALGAYSVLVVRAWISFALVAPVWLAQRGRWPAPEVLRIHALRSVVVALMALTFFSALVYLPLAEALALSFVAPIIALGLAALVLGERVGKSAILASALSLVGVLVIVGGRMGRGRMSDEAALGIALVLVSALLYAWNLILQRQQALVAKPVEIVTFQTALVGLLLMLGAPWFLVLPGLENLTDIGVSALLSVSGALILSWAYARAEAQVLVPVEYTGFLWAALFGWLFFAEAVSGATIAGAALIVVGCWIGAPRKRTEQAAL